MKRFIVISLCAIFVALLIISVWCSTKKHFYNSMCKMQNKSEWCMGDTIPEQLKKIETIYNGPLMEFRKDTLSIVARYPNQNDKKNRYLMYYIQDNHNRAWVLVREPNRKYNYYLYRDDSLIRP